MPLVGPAYILFMLWCIQCHEVQYKHDIPIRGSEEQLLWVQVTPYHPHNWVIIPGTSWVPGRRGIGEVRVIIAPYTCCLEVRIRSSVYTLYSNGANCPPCLIPFEQQNVIDNELAHHTINSCSLYQKMNNFTVSKGTFQSNVSVASSE